jgi:hypothetical protein
VPSADRIRHVHLDGAHRQHQFAGYFSISHASCHQDRHLVFAICQPAYGLPLGAASRFRPAPLVVSILLVGKLDCFIEGHGSAYFPRCIEGLLAEPLAGDGYIVVKFGLVKRLQKFATPLKQYRRQSRKACYLFHAWQVACSRTSVCWLTNFSQYHAGETRQGVGGAFWAVKLVGQSQCLEERSPCLLKVTQVPCCLPHIDKRSQDSGLLGSRLLINSAKDAQTFLVETFGTLVVALVTRHFS